MSTDKEYSADEKWKCLEKKISWNTALYEKYKKCEESSAYTDMREALIHLEQNIQEKYADVRQHVKYSDLPVDTTIFLEDLIRYTEDVFKGVTKAKVKRIGRLVHCMRASFSTTAETAIERQHQIQYSFLLMIWQTEDLECSALRESIYIGLLLCLE